VGPALAGLTGCFPYHQTWRPALRGIVVDQAHRPVPGAQVVSCTFDHWESHEGCPRKAETYAGGDGRYALPELKALEWCCFGEAPGPTTLLTACAKADDGRALRAPSTGAKTEDQQIEVKPPEHPYSGECAPRWEPTRR